MNWYLISEDTVKMIQNILEDNDSSREALYQLNVGLHTTKAIPDDFSLTGHICEYFEEITHQECSHCESYPTCYFHKKYRINHA